MRMRITTLAVSLIAIAASSNSLADAVGRTQGTYATSPTGAATYSIPLWAPPGPHGVQPHIALAYNSQQGNGYVGVGWGLSGLSSIYRCNHTIAQDGAAAPIALAVSDAYCMDGRRLRLTGGTYGAANSTYQTEIANFTNVTAYGTAGNGPAYWQTTDRNGWQYTYGQGGTTSNAEVLASGSSTALSWQLNEVKDPYGNTMTITYSTSNVVGVVVPNVISWVPASAGSSSYNYTMTFSYGTTGSVYGYVGGTPYDNTNILSYITIAYQGTAVKTYYLTYSNTTTSTSRFLLTALQECAGTGLSNCLAKTTLGWQPGALGVGSGTAVSGTVGNTVTTAFDLNGDGINDLVTSASGVLYVAFGSSSGYAPSKSTTFLSTGASVGDADGSGIAGLLVNNSGTWYYYKQTPGAGFVGTRTLLSATTAASPVLADLDGDGMADIAYTDSTGIVHVMLSTSTATNVSFGSDINTGVGIANFTIRSQIAGSNRALHFWGSAQADLLGTEKTCSQTNAKGICTAYQYIYNTLHFTGSTFSVGGLFPSALASPNPAVDFADYNDDGCTDVLTTTQLLLSACNGTTASSLPLPTGATAAVGGMDWNGDGRRDVLVTQPSGTTLGVVLSTGAGLATAVINTSLSSTASYAAAPNLNGDGQDGAISSTGTSATYYFHQNPNAPPDLLTSVSDGYGNSASPTYTTIAQGNYTQATDAPLGYQNYIGPMQVVGEVVFSDPSQTGATFNQIFQYTGAILNLQGRGFQAFEVMETTDSRYVSPNFLYDYRYFETTFPWAGMQYKHSTSTGSFNPMQAVGTPNTLPQATLSSTPNQQRYFPYFTNWTMSQKEVGGAENSDLITTTSTNYAFDNYGNATTIATTATDNDPGSPYNGNTWTTTTTNTTDISSNTSADLSAWCLSLIDETQITYSSSFSGTASVTRTKVFTPDTPALCRIKTITTEPTANSGSYKVTEALTFDGFGNVATDTVTGANMPSSPASRQIQLNWGTTGQFLNSEQDPSGALATFTYTSTNSLTYGVPDTLKDANNQITSWKYDEFGRETQETRPDGTSTTWTLTLCASYCGWSDSTYQVGKTIYQTNGTTAIRTDTNYYDPIDRVTETSGPTVTGSNSVVQTLYNSLGLTSQQSMPFISGATVYENVFYYDVLNRVSSVTRPISATNSTLQSTLYAYAGRKTTVTDPLGHATTTVSDVKGGLRQTQDALGYKITRAFDGAESLTGVTDSLGNTLLSGVTYVYGLKPFKTASTDMDRGSWTYSIDSLGEMISWKDAKNQSFTETYDSLSRPLVRTETLASGSTDLKTTWDWGTSAANYNIGKLADIKSVSGTNTYQEFYTFNAKGQLTDRRFTVPGFTTNAFDYGYSSTTGLLQTLIFPGSAPSNYRLAASYTYQYGLLQKVTDASTQSTIWWEANTANARGQITQETTEDLAGDPQIVSNHAYDPVTGWIQSIQTGVSSGAGLQNESYQFDEMGNLIQRQNNNLGLTEDFYYDNLYRLDHSTLGGTTNLQMCYDNTGGACTENVAGMGNITSRSDVAGGAAWTYDPNHKHQVTQAGSASYAYSYDPNGNVSVRNGSSIGWTSYNYPSAVGTSTESATFDYGPNRQRWRMVYSGASGTETTYYEGREFEAVFTSAGTDFRHYIYAGAKPVVVISRTSAGAINVRSLLSDHQGSLSSIVTDANGTNSVSESFTAYGSRREASTWSGTPTSGELSNMNGVTREGYTFQTVLGSMGLNHMNGRIEDSVTGRFLSADPGGISPVDTQSYNRYTYVMNNPATYTDPTGFDKKLCPEGGNCGGNMSAAEQASWSCYGGGCSGGGWANSIWVSGGSIAYSSQDWFGAGGGTDQGFLGSSPAVDSSFVDQGAPSTTSIGDGLSVQSQDQKQGLDQGQGQGQAQDEDQGQRQDQGPGQSSDDGLEQIIVTAQRAHSYALSISLCFCSQRDAFDAFRNFSAPGAPYAIDGVHKRILPVNNPILQTVDPVAMTINNLALQGHEFGGEVDISFYTSNGVTGVYIEGFGVGPNSEPNQILGPEIFTGLAALAYYYLNQDARSL